MSRCKICYVEQSLDARGRCQGCADASAATALGLHYGDFMAQKEAGALPESPRRARFAAALRDYEDVPELPKCRICGGNVFPPRRYLCSPKCEAEDKRRRARHRTDDTPRMCPVCGKPVRIDRRRIYCSDDCTLAAKREHERIYRKEKRKKGMETL